MRLATWMASRAAEHAYAADRFAREIVGFLKVLGSALAAADRQPVRRQLFSHRAAQQCGSCRARVDDLLCVWYGLRTHLR
jgi:hypothetical protein